MRARGRTGAWHTHHRGNGFCQPEVVGPGVYMEGGLTGNTAFTAVAKWRQEKKAEAAAAQVR